MTDRFPLVYDRLYPGDCIEGMKRLGEGTIDLVFADPPFNIGYEYDVYDDRREDKAYLAWTKTWGREVVRILKPNGAFWLAIGDEYAAELKTLFQNELGLFLRNWVIWYYTFGVHCTRKFSRSHAHLFYFVKDPKRFTFNDQAIRVSSARQMVYADNRANPKGKLPDDTWILRPQDVSEGFSSESDTWYFSRVCGTFKERTGWHGCQMPERLLGRIIEACSNTGDIVLDPFAGSGTTLAVAKKLARRFLGFEISADYAAQISRRLEATEAGQGLQGSSPLESGKRTPDGALSAVNRHVARPQNSEDIRKGITAAFLTTRDGFPVDRVIADPDMNQRYIEMCRRLGLEGEPTKWNHDLMNLRKASSLQGLPPSRVTTFPKEETDKYSFASEIAVQTLSEKYQVSLDRILCDPSLAIEFDRTVLSIVPKDVLLILTPLRMRWAALGMRKRLRSEFKNYALRLLKTLRLPDDGIRATLESFREIPSDPGIYLLQADSKPLYAGETQNLQQRIELQLASSSFDFWGNPKEGVDVFYGKLPDGATQRFGQANQSLLIGRLNPIGNFHGLAVSPE